MGDGKDAADSGAPSKPRRDVVKLAEGIVNLGPNEFTRSVMHGVAQLLTQRENPLRLNLFAVSIRIYLDHLMDALAPQAQVEACRWYKLVKGQDKPVRAQRLAYALHGGFTEQEITELTGIEVKELLDEVIAAYQLLNKHVHGRDETIVRDGEEQDAIIEDVLLALSTLLEEYWEFRQQITAAIVDRFQSEAVDAFTRETVEDIDILATHHTVDWVGIDEREVVMIDATYIEYEVTGSIGVTLIYGSGSDRARGDGAETSEEFPISLRFRMPVDHPHDFDMADITRAVDTSSWFDDGEEDDEDGPDDNVLIPSPF
jgi:hypothetical protein